MQTHNYLQILVALLGIASTILIFIVREQNNRINAVKNQLSEKKYKVYYEVYSIIFDIIKDQKELSETEIVADDLVKRIIDIKKDLLIYAPDNIVQKFVEWNQMTLSDSTGINHFSAYLELFTLIRQDMGHQKTEISNKDILRAIMVSEEETNKMWKMINQSP